MLVADHTKFGREAMVRLGHVADIDELFTDTMPRKAMQTLLAENGVRLHV
jgi:DeoR family glycerol-3-phosphate regulon repressor